MRIPLVFTVLFFCCFTTFSQNTTIDSLSQVLETQEDTSKVNTLINLAFEWRFIDANRTKSLATEAMVLAQSIGFTKGQAQATRNLGLAHSYLGNLDSALYYVIQGKSLAEANGFTQILADALNTIGNIYFRKSQYDSARGAFEESYALFNEMDNDQSKSITLASIAVTYSTQGKYSKALEMNQEALLFFEKDGNANMLANLYHNIANIYLERDEFRKAYEYYQKTSTYDSITGNKSGRAHTMLNVGNILVHLDRKEEAKASYRLAISLARVSGSTCVASLPMTQLGDLYLEEQEYDSAYFYISGALELAQECGSDNDLASVYLDFGEYYTTQGNLDQAIVMLLKGYEVAERSAIGPKMEELSGALHQVYEQKGQYRKAYQYLSIANELHSDQLSEESTKEIARLEAEYEFEKEKQILAEKQKRTELAFEQELARKRWLLASAGVVILLVSLIAFFAYRSYKAKKTANLQLEEKNVRLAELRKSEQKLSEEAIASKERELATMAMASHEKNSLLSDLEQKVSFIEARIGDEMKASIKEMKKSIADAYSLDKSWDSFLHRFEDVHPQFFDKLKDENPALTVDDLKLSAYLKIGMSNKEIANVTHLTLGSVKSKINRLKKKLEMRPEDSLRDFMLKYA